MSMPMSWTPESFAIEVARVRAIASRYSDDAHIRVVTRMGTFNVDGFITGEEGLVAHGALPPTKLRGLYAVGYHIPWSLVDGVAAVWMNADEHPEDMLAMPDATRRCWCVHCLEDVDVVVSQDGTEGGPECPKCGSLVDPIEEDPEP